MKNNELMIAYPTPVNWETLGRLSNLLLRLENKSVLSTTSQSAQARPQLGCLRQKSWSSLPQRLGRSGLLALIRGLGVVIGQHNIGLVLRPARSHKEHFISPLSITSPGFYPATGIVKEPV